MFLHRGTGIRIRKVPGMGAKVFSGPKGGKVKVLNVRLLEK